MDDKLRQVTLRQLQIFLVAAENLSFLRAAEILDLSPPAVSMQMSRLSESLGGPLFEKKGRQVVLTSAGQRLIPYAEKVTHTLKEAYDDLNDLHGRARSTVAVAMVTTSRNFGPHLAARYQAKYPDDHLDIAIANRHAVIEKLEHNQVDLALMGRPPRRLDVEAEAFAEHPYVIIASPNHPLASKKKLAASDLVEESFLGREGGSGTRMVLEHFFQDKDLPLPNIVEMDSNENIKQAVMANMGLAFISKHTIHLELQTGRLAVLPVDDTPQIRTWYVLHLRDKTLSPAAQRFKQFVKDQGPQFMADFFSESPG